MEWSEQTRRTIAPTMHLVETEHFLVFSAWNPSHDSALAAACEEMYEKLRQQFKIPQTDPVWIGKCPIYIFWESGHFRRFSTEVDHVSLSSSSASHADGYHAARGTLAYIVISGVREFGGSQPEAIRRFYEVLVHEGSHAFMNRYISSRSIARWVEEGLADYMAATLVPMSEASHKYVEGARYGLLRPSAVPRLFEKKDLTSIDYGIAQSLVRYLIQRNADAFVQFVRLMKQGTREPDALVGAYGMSRNELLRNWALFVQRSKL